MIMKHCNFKKFLKPVFYPVMMAGLFLVFIFGCKKEDTAELARLGSLTFSEITSTSVVISGNVEYGGGVNVTSRGIVWSTSANPTVENNEGKVAQGSGTGEFVITITGLSPATKYYVRGYATNLEGTAYSDQFELTTEGKAATVITADVTEITVNSAISGGNITDDGGAAITARGIVWGTSENPSLEENEGMTDDGEGSGEFNSQLIELLPGTIYYVRAYATNSQGTAYSDQVEFTTLAGSATVTTSEVTGITANSAVSGGIVTDDGGVEITVRGIVWGTTENPTVDENDGMSTDGDGLDDFTSNLEDLLPATTYYVRAFATNITGTFYGEQFEFTTGVSIATVTAGDVTDITDNSAVAGGIVESDGGAEVSVRGFVWSTLEDPTVETNQGIMNIGSGTGQFAAAISGLEPETTYYLRAFATNAEGTAYGNQVEFTTLNYPQVSTQSILAITDVSASVRGRVIAEGGATTARGIVWSTSENPRLEDYEGMTNNGSGTGFFTADVTGLDAGTTYFARAYAENSVGVSYGDQLEFTTYDGRAADTDGNVYFYVIIGKQEWMVANLKTTKYNDGSSIAEVTDNGDWRDTPNPAYCWYENNGEKFKDVFGALYNFYAVETEKLCPEGWRVPTGADISALVIHAGGSEIAAGKLKGTGYWQDSANPGTDDYRLNSLPGGFRYPDEGDFPGQFDGLNKAGVWWTSTTYEIGAYTYSMSYLWQQIFSADVKKEGGASVRCMRGDPPPDPPMYIAPW